MFFLFILHCQMLKHDDASIFFSKSGRRRDCGSKQEGPVFEPRKLTLLPCPSPRQGWDNWSWFPGATLVAGSPLLLAYDGLNAENEYPHGINKVYRPRLHPLRPHPIHRIKWDLNMTFYLDT